MRRPPDRHHQRGHDRAPHDTGTFASTGTVVAGKAVALTAEALRDNILDYACGAGSANRSAARLEADAVVCGNQRIPLTELHAAGIAARHRFDAKRKAYLSPRTVAFNVHGVRLAVHRHTAEIRIPAFGPCRRYRPPDQPDAVPGPDRWRDRHGHWLGVDGEHGA